MAVPSATSLTMMSIARPEACSPWPLQPPYDVICGKACAHRAVDVDGVGAEPALDAPSGHGAIERPAAAPSGFSSDR